jgi:hypothetical protein
LPPPPNNIPNTTRPSFNGALASIEAAQQHEPDPANVLLPQQYYCVVNTLLSLLGSVLSTFAVSSYLNSGRFNMMHVQVGCVQGKGGGTVC